MNKAGDTNKNHSEKEELDLQLRAVPDIERRIAELTAGAAKA